MTRTYRIIGDTHGKLNDYINLCIDAEKLGIHTIQLGDLAFNYDPVKKYLNPAANKFIKGNHDNHGLPFDRNPHHWLGAYGEMSFDHYAMPDGFFIGGAFSIDWMRRTPGLDYFANEEISQEQADKALALYKEIKPRVMFSHECPRQIARMVGSDYVLQMFGYDPDTFTTSTSELLQDCFEYHQPEQWYFGHFHKSWKKTVNNCNFTCLAELEYIDVEL